MFCGSTLEKGDKLKENTTNVHISVRHLANNYWTNDKIFHIFKKDLQFSS